MSYTVFGVRRRDYGYVQVIRPSAAVRDVSDYALTLAAKTPDGQVSELTKQLVELSDSCRFRRRTISIVGAVFTAGLYALGHPMVALALAAVTAVSLAVNQFVHARSEKTASRSYTAALLQAEDVLYIDNTFLTRYKTRRRPPSDRFTPTFRDWGSEAFLADLELLADAVNDLDTTTRLEVVSAVRQTLWAAATVAQVAAPSVKALHSHYDDVKELEEGGVSDEAKQKLESELELRRKELKVYQGRMNLLFERLKDIAEETFSAREAVRKAATDLEVSMRSHRVISRPEPLPLLADTSQVDDVLASSTAALDRLRAVKAAQVALEP